MAISRLKHQGVLPLLSLGMLGGWFCCLPAAAAPARPAARGAAPAYRILKLSITPQGGVLTGREARQALVVSANCSDGIVRDVTPRAAFTSKSPKVLKVSRTGLVQPVGDGKGQISARVGDASGTAAFEVRDTQKPFVWSFRNHVISVLSKAGCNAGACHGAAAGKNGFRLTLRGYDPDLDYMRLLKESGGRRIVKTDPGHSLFLMKPTMAVPHSGGLRVRPNSLEYRVLTEWIAAGAPGPTDKDPQIERLEVLPAQRVMAPNTEQRLVVLAHFNDGHVEDATRWARYSSNEEAIARVGEDGRITADGVGETAVAVFYLGKVAFTTVTVPFPNRIDAGRYAALPRVNYVDDLVLQKLATLRIWPSELASDAEFCRRVYLDLIGILPTSPEVREFLSDKDPDKRSRLVERLMQRPEFVDFWAYKWSDLMRVSREALTDQGMWAFYEWIRHQVATNRPWDQVVYDVLTGSGSTFDDGPANYYRSSRTPEDLGETTSQAFLGIRVQCARCHNHPFEKWTQNDYYQMANFFARVGRKSGDTPTDLIIFAQNSGDVAHPKLGRPLPPRPYDGTPIELNAPGDRREVLARWITNPTNPYFSRSIVNRVWRHFLGRGLIEPVDDLRATNPASNEPLMGALVKEFVSHKFDLRYLMRTIVNSRTYQLTSRPNPLNRKDDRHYSRYFVRRLTAEQLLDALCQATGVPEKFAGFPIGTRALQLPDTRVGSYFLDVFGRPPRQITCDCERAQEPNMAQALHLINGPGVNQKISAQGGLVDRMITGKKSDAEMIEELYLACFGRYPTDEEKKATLEAVDEAVHPRPPAPPTASGTPAGGSAKATAGSSRAAPGTTAPKGAKPRPTPGVATKPAVRAARSSPKQVKPPAGNAGGARPSPAGGAIAVVSKPAAQIKQAGAGQPSTPPAPALTPEQARRQVLEDLLWALINGKEFIFNH